MTQGTARGPFPRGEFLTAAVCLMVPFAVSFLAPRQVSGFLLAIPGVDKPLHSVQYGVFFLVLHRLATRVAVPKVRHVLLLAAGVLVIGVLDEVVQGILPGRSPDIEDFAADAAGLALAAGVVRAGGLSIKHAGGLAAAALVAAMVLTGRAYIEQREYKIALAYERQGQFDLARIHFRLAIDGGMNSARLWNEAAWVEIESEAGDPSTALRYAKEAIRMAPEDPAVLDTYGWILHHTGQSGEALAPLRRALALDPGIWCIHYHLGAAYAAVGLGEEARRHLRIQIEGGRGAREIRGSLDLLRRLDCDAGKPPPRRVAVKRVGSLPGS